MTEQLWRKCPDCEGTGRVTVGEGPCGSEGFKGTFKIERVCDRCEHGWLPVAPSALLIEDGMTFDQILDAVQALGFICASRPPGDTTMEPGRFHIGANLMALAEAITDHRAAVGEGR